MVRFNQIKVTCKNQAKHYLHEQMIKGGDINTHDQQGQGDRQHYQKVKQGHGQTTQNNFLRGS